MDNVIKIGSNCLLKYGEDPNTLFGGNWRFITTFTPSHIENTSLFVLWVYVGDETSETRCTLCGYTGDKFVWIVSKCECVCPICAHEIGKLADMLVYEPKQTTKTRMIEFQPYPTKNNWAGFVDVGD